MNITNDTLYVEYHDTGRKDWDNMVLKTQNLQDKNIEVNLSDAAPIIQKNKTKLKGCILIVSVYAFSNRDLWQEYIENL